MLPATTINCNLCHVYKGHNPDMSANGNVQVTPPLQRPNCPWGSIHPHSSSQGAVLEWAALQQATRTTSCISSHNTLTNILEKHPHKCSDLNLNRRNQTQSRNEMPSSDPSSCLISQICLCILAFCSLTSEKKHVFLHTRLIFLLQYQIFH